MAGKFFGKSRSQKRAENNLGVVHVPNGGASKKCRSQKLKEIDKYIEDEQYDGLVPWNEAECMDEYVPIRRRKPSIIYPMADVVINRLSSKLLGASTFPSLGIEDDPMTEEFMKIVIKSSFFKSRMLQVIKYFVGFGSCFARSKLVDGNISIERYNPNYCYPLFDSAGNLESIEIKYVYEDWDEIDEKGRPTEKWYKLELSKTVDILYDNPKYEQDANPIFQVVAQNAHNLGFVQGEWFRTTEDKHSPDGDSIIPLMMDFIDSWNYNLSQSDRATSYGLDPQLALTGMDEDEVEGLIKSSSKGWNLGREGQANFLEVSGSGVQTAIESRKVTKQDIQDIVRVAIMEPEKIVGSAQSAKAMEVLHGPMVELINEYRPQAEKGIVSFLQKIIATLVVYNQRGAELAYTMPPQYKPISLSISAIWPEIFPMTMADLQQKVSVGVQAANANLVSRETIMKWLQKDFGIEDIEEEINRINTQKEFNSWGGF